MADKEIPLIISVDDHVVEPPDLWTSRMTGRFADQAPRVARERIEKGHWAYGMMGSAGVEGWWDFWEYADLRSPFPRASAKVGLPNSEFEPVTFDDLHPASWQQGPRLAAMDENHVEASLCFPNVLPRFCGQTFLERGERDVSLECVKAYNDWMIDDWCGGAAHGRLIPLTIVPLWDAELAAAEVRRCAAKGSHAVAFSEEPSKLGLPSVHDKGRYWDPFFAACAETETVLNMHIGSSSRMFGTSDDAPFVVSSTLTFVNSMGSLVDYLLCGVLVRFPNLRIAYSEGQVGWAPYVLERADKLWHERGRDGFFGMDLPEPPSTYIPGRVYFCMFDDETGLENRHRVGMDQITFEVDFPHTDTTYPESKAVATKICAQAGLTEAETYKLLRGNAIEAYGLERWGITA